MSRTAGGLPIISECTRDGRAGTEAGSSRWGRYTATKGNCLMAQPRGRQEPAPGIPNFSMDGDQATPSGDRGEMLLLAPLDGPADTSITAALNLAGIAFHRNGPVMALSIDRT